MLPGGDAAEGLGDDVVHSSATRAELDRLDPAVLGELFGGQLSLEVGVLVFNVVFDDVVFAHVEHEIGLTDRPGCIGPFDGGWGIGDVTSGGAGLCPADQSVTLIGRQATLVGEDTVGLGGRVPRRHVAILDLACD